MNGQAGYFQKLIYSKGMQAQEHSDVTCPHCFEVFTVPSPFITELPVEWDYDCEVCCRPMLIRFYEEDGEIFADADLVD